MTVAVVCKLLFWLYVFILSNEDTEDVTPRCDVEEQAPAWRLIDGYCKIRVGWPEEYKEEWARLNSLLGDLSGFTDHWLFAEDAGMTGLFREDELSAFETVLRETFSSHTVGMSLSFYDSYEEAIEKGPLGTKK